MSLLSTYANAYEGLTTGDLERYVGRFWERPAIDDGWAPFIGNVTQQVSFGGREQVLYWEGGVGSLAASDGSYIKGEKAWGKRGLRVSQTSSLLPTFYCGELFDKNAATIIPLKDVHLAAIYCFCRSPAYAAEVRKIDQTLKVTTATLVKVPFDLAHWQALAEQEFPRGLPRPHSDDPTQWLFNGHPKGSEQPLHVSVARLLGYRWPRQTGSSFPDCPALPPDALEKFADADGIVCLPPLNKEQPGAVRLRALLGHAFGSEWSARKEQDLLAASESDKSSLEEWLRDEFFEQHCALFHQRPFIWHIWDGRKDGFHALANYHQLDNAALQKLTYSYLGDWIRQQERDAKADKPGAAERLGAAQALQAELTSILKGEPPYDIFVRWKPLAEQPIGWNPDLNDGVRLNIRPFMKAVDMGKKGAGVLRARPKTIHWEKDRGKEPKRSKAEYPWFWSEEPPPTDYAGGRSFTGHRWNDVHITTSRKRSAR